TNPQFTSQKESMYHKVSRKKYGKLKHNRHKSRHILNKTKTWLSSDVLWPTSIRVNHNVPQHPSCKRNTYQTVNKSTNCNSRWCKSHRFVQPVNRKRRIVFLNMMMCRTGCFYSVH